MKKAAIVILNWNGVHHLKEFLPSVINYTPGDIADIIVADNGSTDESIAYIQSNYSKVQILKLDKNYGFAGGYNKALEQIEHPILVLLNSDVAVTENWLIPLIDVLEKDEKIASVMPKIKSYLQQDTFEYAGAAGGYIDYLGYPFCRGRWLDKIEKDSGQYNDELEVFWATGACMCIKNEVFKKAGGFDSSFFAHMEEIDLCWRIIHLGYKNWYTSKATVYHLGGGTLNKTNPRKTYLNYRNNLMMLYKNLPANKLNKVLFIRKLLDGLSAIKHLLSFEFKHAIAILNAHIDYYKSKSELKVKRTAINPVAYPKSLIMQKSIILKRYLNY